MKQKEFYEHKVQYYETDQMQVVHHSNYIRWFEEARTDFMERVGFGYDEMERMGICCPVIEAGAKYLRMTRFAQVVQIKVTVKSYNGIKMIVAYDVIHKDTGMINCIGETKHCFLNEKGQPISLKKGCPSFHELILKYMEAANEMKRKEELR